MKRIIFAFFVMIFFLGILWSQASLWRDQNPYAGFMQPGSVVQILVKEQVVISANDVSEAKNDFKLMKSPDKNYLEFLSGIDHNENSSRKYSEKIKYQESMEFIISGVLGEINGSNITIRALKNINIDGKPFNVEINGLVDPATIRNRKVASADIANFTMTIQSERSPAIDTSINLKEVEPEPQEGEEVEPPPPSPEAKLSAEETERIKLDYLRKAVGALQ